MRPDLDGYDDMPPILRRICIIAIALAFTAIVCAVISVTRRVKVELSPNFMCPQCGQSYRIEAAL